MLKNIVDMHNHTDNSFDGNYKVSEMCDSAINYGVKCIAITDHVEMDMFLKDSYDKVAENSFNDVINAKKDFEGKLEVLAGVELGEPAFDKEMSEMLLNKYSYDIVVGSLHNLRNMQDFSCLDYSNIDLDKLLKEYFYELKNMVEWGNFNTLAHMTYPLRYIIGENKIPFDLSVLKKETDEVLSSLAEKDIALEINTSGLRQALGETMPNESIVKRFKQLGGRLVTVGSDAHYTIHVGSGIESGMMLAKRCGFDCVTVFKNRIAQEIPIE